MRTRIWNEITKTKHDIEYIQAYIYFQEKINRRINILALIFSSSGVLSWAFFKKPEFAGFVCVITGGISLIKIISPFYVLSEKDKKQLDKYNATLIRYYDKIEKFWYDNEDDKIQKAEISNGFYSIIKEGNKINETYGHLSIRHITSLTLKAKKNTDIYFENNFN